MSDEQKRDEPLDARAKREQGLPANYGGATPEEVALAVLRYRPGKKKRQVQEREQRGDHEKSGQR